MWSFGVNVQITTRRLGHLSQAAWLLWGHSLAATLLSGLYVKGDESAVSNQPITCLRSIYHALNFLLALDFLENPSPNTSRDILTSNGHYFEHVWATGDAVW